MWRMILILALSCSLTLTGCGRTTTFVREGKPVKLAKAVKTQAYVPDESGKEVLAEVVLLPGMVCGFPPPKPKPDSLVVPKTVSKTSGPVFDDTAPQK